MGLKYKLNQDGKSYGVIGCDCNVVHISVPKTHNKKPVTDIGYRAFSGNSDLASITIPASVTTIGDCAFAGCRGLTSISIGNGVTSIGAYAFWGCRGLTSITIPDSVTTIGDCAFYGCSGLTSISITDGVTSIGGSAFNNCGGLTSILPENHKKVKAVKGFNANLTCRDFEFEIGKTYTRKKPKLCQRGFHACTTGFDLFNYYFGKDNEDVVFYEVELDGITNERGNDSKVCSTSIRLLRKLTIVEAANYRWKEE